MATGCYKDEYLPASYKGIAFQCLETTSEHGRRGAEGEFPFGEDTAYADMGRRIRTYSVHGRFMDNNHILMAGLLVAACELPGPGLLIHPTRGPVMVACKQLRITDNPTEEAGVTTFDMDMVEANVLTNGFSFLLNNAGILLTPLIAAVELSFNENYHPDEVTFYDRTAVMDAGQVAISGIIDAYQQATASEQNVKIWRSLASFNTLLQDQNLMSKTSVMFAAMRDGMALVDKYGVAEQKKILFRTIINQNSGPSGAGRSGEGSVNAVQNVMRTLGAGYLARAVLEAQVADMYEAFAQYDAVVKVFDEELTIAKTTCDTRLFIQLSAFVEDVKAKLLDMAYNTPAVIEYKFAGPVNSLAAAYEIFGDATRFPEIEARNPNGWPWQVGPVIIAAR